MISGGSKELNAGECLQILIQSGGLSCNIVSETSFNNNFFVDLQNKKWRY